MKQAFLRPVRLDDFDDILALAQISDGGMTNLPPDPPALRQRVEFAVESFAKNASEPSGEVYMMVLDVGGKVLGTSAVFSAVGLDYGFVNYRINKTVHASKQLKKRIERRLLVPTHDFTGCGEVGSLFVSPEARGGGYGKFLGKARYLFIAMHRDLIASPVCAELRGWRGPNGEQPFWDAIGKPFFDMEFEAADVANAAMGNQFISDLMPRHPIYTALLPEAARETLGKPHDNAAPAFNMLLKEGFSYRGYIDVFDGGPLVDAEIDDILTVRNSKNFTVDNISDDDKAAPLMLLASGRLSSFRVVRAPARVQDKKITIGATAASLLNVRAGATVRAIEW